ncbi:dimethylarginine dimethylaminohydrolase family protein [Lichenifustis flavocetrariae]|uniref:arginine deiminase n=1 Tax=Lichenifustis flavocetrariae TaxID=2949735 RepID=A0AA41Z436_9HYPH|nr:arginine deiminase family protein [Lichenifustis flavocetrariae]MCW6509970.1 arginine deiminase family protein [Lichenifustis flavocetrariae]
MVWTIDSETGVLTDVLLGTPDHYHWIHSNAIATQTLGTGRQIDVQRLQNQFRQLEDAFDAAGVKRHYVEVESHLPYQVYTRDSSQTTPWGPVLTQLALPARRGEAAAILRFHGASDGFWRYASRGTIEGGDIHIIRPGLLVLGWSGVRTTQEGAEQFAGWFREQGWEVRLEPFAEHFLHLDVLFCMAAAGLAVACIEVLGDGFRDWLAAHDIQVVEASYREVMAMSCNLLALGRDRVISPRHSTRINAALRAEGLTVYEPDLDLFAAGGGSVHCMTMPLRREPG